MCVCVCAICECHLASLKRTYYPAILLLNWQQQKNNKDDDDRSVRKREKKMEKSAFKRFNSILETINIVYRSQQLLHRLLLLFHKLLGCLGIALALCLREGEVCAFVLPWTNFTSTVSDIFAQTHWCMNKRLAVCNPFAHALLRSHDCLWCSNR